jgi:hypothetical protein
MPLAVVAASTNENEKKHAPELLDRVCNAVEDIKAVIADSQYSLFILNHRILSPIDWV